LKIKTVNLKTENMPAKQKEKAIIAADMALDFFQSSFFRNALFGIDMFGLRGESQSSVSKRFSTSGIYNLFMSGKEEWNDIEDYEIDLIVSRYTKRWSRVVGYIIPMKPKIFVNSEFFDNNTTLDICSNFCHEYAHTLGFRHSGPHIKESLPYLINDWVEKYFLSISVDDNYPSPVTQIRVTKTCKRVWWKLWLGKVCYDKITREG